MVMLTMLQVVSSQKQIDHVGSITLVVNPSRRPESAKRKRGPVRATHFRVQKDVLVDRSDYFARMLQSGGFRESGSDEITLTGDDPDAMEVWLCQFHESDMEHTYELPVNGVTEVLAIAQKYQFKVPILRNWFSVWLEHGGKKAGSDELLYPAFAFDDAKLFAKVTKDLVYRGGDALREIERAEHLGLHLPPRFIGESCDSVCFAQSD